MHRIAFAAILAAGASACVTIGGGYGPVEEYTVDQAIPLGPDASAEVNLRAGPFEIVKVLVRNAPTEKDVLEDKRGTDRSHPKPVIVARSFAKETARVTLASILEDEDGQPLMTCSGRKDQDLDGGTTDDWNTCFLEAIRTADWPRVKFFHLIVTFRVQEEAAQPPQ